MVVWGGTSEAAGITPTAVIREDVRKRLTVNLVLKYGEAVFHMSAFTFNIRISC